MLFDFLKKYECKNENLYREVVEATRSSLDIEKTKRTIIDVIGKALNADRCFIVEYDKKNDRFKEHTEEYLSSPNLKSYVGVDLNLQIPRFVNEFKKGKSLIFNQDVIKINGQEINLDDGTYEAEKIEIEEYKVYSAVVFPIFYAEEYLGELVVHYVDKKHHAGDDEINLLKMVSNQVGIALYQAKIYDELKKHAEREHLLRETIERLRSSVGIKAIRQKIVDILGQKMNADRCFIIEYDKELDKFLSVEFEYLSGDNISSYKGSDINDEVPNFADALKKGESIIVKEKDIILETNNKDFSKENQAIERHNVNSAFAFPLYYKNELLGALAMHYIKSTSNLEDDDVDLLKDIANQIAIELYQSNLHKRAQGRVKRESILRDIVETIRSTLDLNEMKKQIVTQIGKAFNVERCIIHQVNPDTQKFYIIDEFSEYIALDEISSYVGIDIERPSLNFFREMFSSGKEMIVPNWPDYLDKLEDVSDKTKEWIRSLDIKSDYVFPIIFDNKLLATFYLTYTQNYKNFSEEDLNDLRLLTNQIGIALNQAESYEKQKELAEREKITREIITFMYNTSDINKVKEKFVSTISEYMGAERGFIVEYDNIIKSFLPVDEFSEYRSSSDVESMIGFDWNSPSVQSYIELLKEKQKFNISDVDNYIIQNKLVGTELDILFRKHCKLKSVFNILTKYENEILVFFCMDFFTKQYNITEKDELFVSTLVDQASIVISQFRLKEKEKRTAKREILLREITEKIRSSLDIEETLSYICEETAKVFQVERTAITRFPNLQNFEEFSFRKEYKQSDKIKGFEEVPFYKKVAAFWGEKLTKSDSVIAINDISNTEEPDYFKEAYVAIGVKAIMGTSIKRNDYVWGTLVLAEYSAPREWSEDEKTLLKAIAAQVNIAINQAELYEKEKHSAEIERISRNIIEILRSSLDKTIIKKQFVKNIGKFFNADRVFFSEYDSKIKMYMPVDEGSEYLSNSNEKSLTGYDWSNPEIIDYIKPLLERREVKIPNWNDYVQQHPDMSEGFRKLYEDINIKSSYSFPVLHQTDIIGYFCVEFTQKVSELTNEDIDRIRSICTQAGIALYQANLYIKAQEATSLKTEFISKTVIGAKKILNNIIELSEAMTGSEIQCEKHIEHLNHVNENIKMLLELTDNLTEGINLS